MSSSAELHLSYKVGNAPMAMFPFPHMFVHDVFPQDFYEQIQQNLPHPEAMLSIEEAGRAIGYKERFVMDFGGKQFQTLPDAKRRFWESFQGWLVDGRFGAVLFNRFAPFIEERYQGQPMPQFYDESLLVQDITNYELGPHTDSPHKVITLLFYLPKNDTQRHMGTCIYVPKEPGFSCPGGPHYPHDKFELLQAMPFVPNSLFCFLKTHNSFHGVEPVADPNCRRWLLLYDIYARDPAKAAQPAAAPPGVKFSF